MGHYGLILVVVIYLSLTTQRKETKAERDNDTKTIKERLSVVETRIESFDELKIEVREMNKTLQKLVGMFEIYSKSETTYKK